MVHVEVREAERDTRESDQIRRDVLDHRYFLTSIEQKKKNKHVIFPFTEPADPQALPKTCSSPHACHGQTVHTSP